MSNRNSVIKSLKHQVQRLTERLKFLEKRSDKYSWNRLKVFLSFLILSIVMFSCSGSTLGWIIIAIGSSLFSIIVHFHNKLIYAISRYKLYISIKESNLARVQLNWDKLHESKESILNAHSFEIDLDLIGRRSLHKLLNTSHSSEGSKLLRTFLLETDPKYSEIIKRQQLVKELTLLSLFRDKFLLKAVSVSKKQFEGDRIITWLDAIEQRRENHLLLYLSTLLIVSYIILFILFSLGLMTALWLIPFLMYLILYMWFSKRSDKFFKATSLINEELCKVRILFEHIENIPLKNKNEVIEFLKPFLNSKQKPSHVLKKLEKLSEMTAARGNPFVKIILNALMPWDIYLSISLSKSRNKLRDDLPVWLKTLYELEALNSLANFSYINPEYNFPDIVENENSIFDSVNLGHPLIPFDDKIVNNFSFNKENEILIVTGSNMSGKSTFLKTIGINLCLAYSGAPVNADVLRVSLFRLFTCIKVSDSVTDGISYFYAEVRRLKELLNELEKENKKPLFFLIDEIFSGTNNKERSIGSREYIKAVSKMKASGAIATHDLNLIELEKEINNITNYHFREEIKNGRMVFDYKLYTGPCPTTNAIKVMQLAGLPIILKK